MKVINLTKPQIEIPFEDNGKPLFSLFVDRSDETLLKIGKVQKKLEDRSNELIDDAMKSVGSDEELIERAKDVQREAYDTLLGEGSFDKVYKVVGAIEQMSAVLLTICEGIKNEIQSERTAVNNRINKYLNK